MEPEEIGKRKVDVRATPKQSGNTNQKSEMRRINGSYEQRQSKKCRSNAVQQRKIQKRRKPRVNDAEGVLRERGIRGSVRNFVREAARAAECLKVGSLRRPSASCSIADAI